MRISTLSALAVSVGLAVCVSVSAAPMTKEEYEAAKDDAKAHFKADKAACDTKSGNAKDICIEEAKGRESVALAELESRYEPSPRSKYKQAVARADADYAVARQKCNDLSGDARSTCRAEAKSAHTAAIDKAKLSEKNSKDANVDSREPR